MKLRAFILLPLLAISFSFAEPCIPSSKKGPPQPGPNEVVYEVTTIYPRLMDQPRQVKGKGIFKASDRLTVKAAMSGSIEKVYVGEGDHLAVGDPICLFKNEELNALIEKKQAELKEVEATLEHSQKTLDVLGGEANLGPPAKEEDSDVLIFLDEEAPKKKVTPKPRGLVENAPVSDKTTLDSKIRIYETRVERLNKDLDQLEAKLQKLTVPAPIAGIIQKRHITEGSLTNQGDPLFDIVTIDPITLSFHIPQRVSSYVDKLVKVVASPTEAEDVKSEGSVFFISPSVNTANKTLEIRAHIPNPKGLIREGQEGTATITTRKIDKILVVPRKILIRQDDKHFLYVVAGTQAQKTEIQLGKELDDGEIQIDANLRVDDPIIVSGLEKLKDGSFVKIVEDKQPTATPQPEEKTSEPVERKADSTPSKNS